MSAPLWDHVVGIDVDDWMRADTPEQVEWLAWLRDHPMPRPAPPQCSCPTIEVYSFGDEQIRMARTRRDPDCLAHRPEGQA